MFIVLFAVFFYILKQTDVVLSTLFHCQYEITTLLSNTCTWQHTILTQNYISVCQQFIGKRRNR